MLYHYSASIQNSHLTCVDDIHSDNMNNAANLVIVFQVPGQDFMRESERYEWSYGV